MRNVSIEDVVLELSGNLSSVSVRACCNVWNFELL